MVSNLFKKNVKSALTFAALIFGITSYGQMSWSEMGPNDLGGRCRSVIVDKTVTSGKTLYAAGVSGGVFKSDNGGSTWLPINNQSNCIMVSSMSQSADGTLWIGTGETFGRGGDGAGSTAFVGNGLYKLAPGTSSFVLVKDSSAFGNINEVGCDRNNKDRIYVASERGLKMTIDGGTSWLTVSTTTIAAMDVKVAADNSVYYSEGTVKGSTSKVYYSANGDVGTFAERTLTVTNRGRIEIAVAENNSNIVYISIATPYISTSSTSAGLRAIYISDTRGATWSLITLGSVQFDPFTSGKGYGDYSQAIAVDPTNAYSMFIGGYAMYNWNQTTGSPLGQGAFSQVGYPFNFFPQAYLHPKIHSLAFSPDNSLYFATDGGIYKAVVSPSAFGPYAILQFNKGLNIAQFNSVSMQNYPYNTSGSVNGTSVTAAGGVAGGTNGNGLVYLQGNLTNTAASVPYGFGDAFQTDFSKILPKSLFYSGNNGSIYRTLDITINSPATFYDATYKTVISSGPGSTGFASENTPMRLWENYGQINPPTDSAIFYNAAIKSTFVNINPAQSSFAILSTRPQRSGKYDSIYVEALSTKKTGQQAVSLYTVTNSVALSAYASFSNANVSASQFTVNTTRGSASLRYDSVKVKANSYKLLNHPALTSTTWSTSVLTPSTQTTFTVNNTRPQAYAKYDNIVIKTSSFKLLGASGPQTITIKPTYTGSMITSYVVTGANNTPTTNNVVFINSSMNDSIRFTFVSAPKDSCNITMDISYKYYQNITLLPAYTGSAITSYTVLGEANNAPSTNNMVFLNTNLNDSIRFTFANAPNDSSFIWVRSKFKAPVTYTIAHTRPSAITRYDSIIIRSKSNKLGAFAVPGQTITIVPVYTGSTITSYNITGGNSSTFTNNLVFANASLADSIRFTFNNPPGDSSNFFVRIKHKFTQGITIVPVYTGTAITGHNVAGEANVSSANNNTVTLKSTLADSIRFTFKTLPGDSTSITTTVKLRYDVGSYVTTINNDITGLTLSDSSLINTTLYTYSKPAFRKIPLRKSARLAVGLTGNVVLLKRPLNFSTSIDFIKIAGSNSRMDSAGIKAKRFPMRGSVTRLEWANNGRNIYMSSRVNDSTFFLYRISGLENVGDSTSGDYSGLFTTDIDSLGTPGIRTAVKTRLTFIGKFKYPVTSISVLKSDTAILVTTGSYKNKTGTVYYSNGNVTKLPIDSIGTTNFTLKNGTGGSALPVIPAYSSLFEMNDNKKVFVGTETGLYSTADITAANPTWVKENNTTLPNVPVFQLRQQTLPNWHQYANSAAYNSGVIYVATHGRGIWSSNAYHVPYYIGIEEVETPENTFSASMKLYPNPTNADVNVWFNTPSEGKFKVRVMDVSGRLIMEQNAGELLGGEQVLNLNTSGLNNGIYFVSVTGTNNFNSVSKLVITK